MKNEDYAFELSLRYITHKRRTENEVYLHLKSKVFVENDITFALNKLKEYKYVDDVSYAQDFISEAKLLGKLSKASIVTKLRQKGIDEFVIEDTMVDFDDELEYLSALKLAKSIFAKNLSLEKHKLKQKIFKNLSSKGFSYENIEKSTREIFTEQDYD